MADIHKAAGIIIKDRKVLLERSPSRGKMIFVSPGGKLEPGETVLQALVRELKEELDIEVKTEDVELFSVNEAEAANNPGKTVRLEIFMIKKYTGEPHPSSEVEELAWVNSKNDSNLPLGSVFEHTIIPKLKQLDLID